MGIASVVVVALTGANANDCRTAHARASSLTFKERARVKREE